MNKNVLMMAGGALAVVILLALIVQAKFSGGKTEVPSASIEVLVANKKLALGQKIKPNDVRWQPWEKESLYTGMIKKEDQKDLENITVYNTPLKRNIEPGEPITMQAVIADAKDGNSFLAASIEPGKRAMAVSVKPETSVGGFLSPGDYVDVILSFAPTIANELQDYSQDIIQRYASQTILSNVKILAVDQEAKDEEREAKVPKTVTLEVNKQQAEILALSANMGDLSLALRHIGDKDTPQDSSAVMTTDSATFDVLKKVQEIMIKDKTSTQTVRMYAGTSIQNVPVRTEPVSER